MQQTAEHHRLLQARDRIEHWKRWGPYLSERQWGTVREDYSPHGTAWEYLPHDLARSKAYRWGEDGIAGLSDNHQRLCFALSLWNGRDTILKERLFGLTGNEGNHGEDVKECYFYLDSTPTHSYMKYLYKYPHNPFPYEELLRGNRERSREDSEYELLDTGIFNDSCYFDVYVEVAKENVDELYIKITAANRGAESAPLHLLPTLWYRNTWSWDPQSGKPQLAEVNTAQSGVCCDHPTFGRHWFDLSGEPTLLFTENETNRQRLYGHQNESPYTKDAFHRYLVEADESAVNVSAVGTKTAGHYALDIEGGAEVDIWLRLANREAEDNWQHRAPDIMSARKHEADEFYEALADSQLSPDARKVQRQALSGVLWSKQFFHYDVREWLNKDEEGNALQRESERNASWSHLYNEDIISMPDKWEYPWYAAWDLAFHCVPIALVDVDFAKEQLALFLREWYMHPNGQIPAYEWAFDDVNPPVHAWAVWRIYKIEKKMRGRSDREFLERAFHKLLLNFTWWVNRKDQAGNNIFEGGFLGLDNIGVFDRSAPLPTGEYIEQSDGTSWMGMYCLNMLAIALELARENKAYSDIASKFFEHFVYISHAINHLGDDNLQLWDEEDGFFYDALCYGDDNYMLMKVRSMVGLITLFAVEALDPEIVDALPGFKRRMEWFIENRPHLRDHISYRGREGDTGKRLLAIVGRDRLKRVLKPMLDEAEFLSPYGIRSLSRTHLQQPYILNAEGEDYRVDYVAAESNTALFGGNSNWRGPVWFPLNFLLIEALQKFHYYYGDEFKVECPTGSGEMLSLWEIAAELSRRQCRIFLQDNDGQRPVYGGKGPWGTDPHWQDILFFEYFNGDNGMGLGANHQTGWTALVAKLLQQSGTGL